MQPWGLPVFRRSRRRAGTAGTSVSRLLGRSTSPSRFWSSLRLRVCCRDACLMSAAELARTCCSPPNMAPTRSASTYPRRRSTLPSRSPGAAVNSSIPGWRRPSARSPRWAVRRRHRQRYVPIVRWRRAVAVCVQPGQCAQARWRPLRHLRERSRARRSRARLGTSTRQRRRHPDDLYPRLGRR